MNGQKVKLTDETRDFINSWNMVTRRTGTWAYIPFWFKKTDDPNVVEVYSFDHLPQDLIEFEAEQREKILANPDRVNNRPYPLVESECFKVSEPEQEYKKEKRPRIVKNK